MSDEFKVNLDQALTNKMTVHENLHQEIIVTNTDKVKLILNKHHDIVRKKHDWAAPFSVFLSVLATLLTAKFETKSFGIEAHIWNAIFMIVCVISAIWSLVTGIHAIYYIKEGSVEKCIEEMKIQNQPKKG